MGLFDEVVSPKKKERVRARRPESPKSLKKLPEKTRSSTDKSVPVQQTSSNSFFDSLKRVQGALSPGLKTKTSTPKQDVKKKRTASEVIVKSSEKNKDKEREKRPWFRSPSRNSLKKEPVKSSTASLSINSLQKVTADPKKRRPITVAGDAIVNIRRGQHNKIEGQNLGDNLSRASSVTNLEAEPRHAKGAKPRKSSSRDRIDKIGGDGKKSDKKGSITRNNNKLETGDNSYPSVDSLSEEELLQLRRQLQEMAQEKTNLALQLGEHKGQLHILHKEIEKLKSIYSGH